MARPSVGAGFGRLPGRVGVATPAYFRKAAIGSARADMADIISRYEAFVSGLKDMTPTVLFNALQPVFNRSQIYVPKKTGALAASGEINVFPLAGDSAEGEIVYGNSEAWYASLVHEYVWLNHAAPTRSKYLQAALEEEIDSFMTSIIVDYGLAMGF